MRVSRMWAAAGLAVAAVVAAGAVPAQAATLPFGTVRSIVQQVPFSTANPKTFALPCNAGERVLGGGAFTVGGVHAVITEMQPIHPATGPDSFQVTAAADQFGIAGTWSMQVFAFCAVVPASVQLEIRTLTNPPTSATVDQAVTRCSPGKVVMSTGGRIDNGNGQVDLGTVPTSSGILATGSSAIAKEDADGFAGFYTVTGYSVCGRPNLLASDFQMRRVQVAAAAGVSSLSNLTFCPSGTQLTGFAGYTDLFGTHLQRLTPNLAGGRTAFGGTFGAQSSVTPTFAWNMDTTIFCAQ
ncbi:hypothetical protein [Virgisporangium aurantiacum]|nr:hypothetical protein [Virgisporangium aurantiacum]